MLPILFKVGPVTVYSYGVMLAIAFAACTGFLMWYLPRKGMGRDEALDLVLAAAVGGLIGARVLYVVSFWKDFAEHPLWAFQLWRGGMIFYGGAVLGSLVVLWYALRRKLRVPVIADVGGMTLALGSAIGRLGCFLNGCCYGAPSDSIIACSFPGTGNRVLPTQLFDSASNLFIFGLLLFVATRPRIREGFTWWLYVTLYGISRFTIEIFRVNPRGLFGLSQAQQLSVVAMLIGLGAIAWLWRHGGLWEASPARADGGGDEPGDDRGRDR